MKNLLIAAVILLVVTYNSRLNAAEISTGDSLPGFLLESISAAYYSVALHELGHYNEAKQINIAPRIKLGFIRTKAPNGSSSYYLGKTAYEKYPDNPEIRARLALAGIESSTNTYNAINDRFQAGEISDRFSSMLALLCKTDFPRYALIHRLKPTPDPDNDIENYIQNSGTDKEFIYTAAVLDIIFNFNEIAFHTKRIFGHTAEFPQTKEVFGCKAKPVVFVGRDMGIAIGVNMKKAW